MKIYFVQDKLRGGGTERQSIELVGHLDVNDAEARLIVGAKGGPLDTLGQEQLRHRIEFISKRETVLSHIRAYFYLYRRTGKYPTTVVCMGFWAHLLYSLLPKSRELKLVSTIRGNRGLPLLYRRCIRKSDLLIANSHYAIQYVSDRMGPACLPRTAVIHNPLSRPELLEIGPEERRKAREELKVSEDQFILLNAARLVRGKGQCELIRAAAKLTSTNWQLWLLGEGPEKAELQQLAADLGIANRVFFPGFHENLRIFYALADLFISASTLDSLPNALIEAHASELPIVAYPNAGIPEIVEHEKTGILCRENSPQEMAHWIHHAMENKEWRQKLGKDAREKVRVAFNRERLHQNFGALLSAIQI